jgi:shikimate dehydrogenase
MKDSSINSATGLYCIFGNPVRHSISPFMHNAAFAEAGINAVYLAFEPASIAEAVSAVKALEIRGASVTIPFKIDVMRHLDEIDPLAGSIGSVNTIINRNGTLTGYNTDGYGAVLAIEQCGITLKGMTFMVIGNGGSARAIAFTLAERKAGVIIAGRNENRIKALADDIRHKSPAARSALLKEIDSSFMESVDVIINTTSVGMAPDTESTPLDPALIASRHVVFDIVYTPRETSLLASAKKLGCRVIYGVDMLVLQGARQFELWTGKKAPVETMRRAAHRHLSIPS